MQLNVNPLNYPSIVCDKCGSEVFVPGVVFKRIPGVVMGSGTEDTCYPIPVYICSKCGELMPEYKKSVEKTEENKESKTIQTVLLS